MSAHPAANWLIAYWTGLPANFRGILWLSLGSFLFTFVEIFVKTLGRKFDPLEITLFRYGVGFIVLMPLFVRMGLNELKTQRIGLHILRMSLAFVSQLGIYVSVIYLPLADAVAFMFSKPLFTTLVAVFLLSEVVTARRWVATVIGFGGVLIMVRPGSESMDPVALVAVGAAFTFAIANVLIRMLSVTEPTNRILFYYHIGGVLVFAGPAIFVWQTPVGVEWLLLIGIGVFTAGGFVCVIRAFSAGEANAVGPAENLRLIYAALLGYLLFQEIPSLWTVAGAVLIVASTYYIAQFEARQRPPS